MSSFWVDQIRTAHPGCDVETVRAGIHAAFGLLNSTPYSADHLSPTAAEQLLTRLALQLLQSLS